MKRILSCMICLILSSCLLFSAVPKAAAYEIGEAYHFDLSPFISNPRRCHFVEMMLSWYLKYDEAVQQTLADGYSAVFFFEGCSDNMDDPELSDLSYYRVSAVCVAVRLLENGEPELTYYNEDCSTLPDRAHQYGAWELEGVGEVGPATVLDGTYELYSVYHGGVYEALHVQTTAEDDKIDAVYMQPGGRFVKAKATAINIHTRTGNHVIRGSMWSAGCILVGDGESLEYEELIASTYYAVYDDFRKDERVGTVTINRQFFRQELCDLYLIEEAVDTLLSGSQCTLPEAYLKQCVYDTRYKETKVMIATKDTDLMTLPCSTETDVRSVPAEFVPKGGRVQIIGSLFNTRGSLWYEVMADGETYYIYSSDVRDRTRLDKFFERFQ